MSARALLLASGLGCVAVLLACGSSSDSSFGSSGGESSGASGPGSSSFGGSSGASGTSGGTSGASGSGSCSAPVDMYIMFDRSGSMGNDCNIGQTVSSKWCHAVNALSGYFNSPSAKDQAAALQFFPSTSHTDSLCTTGATYDTPSIPSASAEFTTLPTNAFDMLLNSTFPDNVKGSGGFGTPTEGAIRGLDKYTEAHRRPGRVTIGILITDGDPNGCDTNLGDLSNLLQAHFTASTLRTYVVGMQGADFGNLEKIAVGGNAPMHANMVTGVSNACGNGAAMCRSWNVGDGSPAAFIAALAAIQDSADGCKPGGGTVNPPR